MNILGIVPARGGSKGFPRKNVRELAGKPLIAYSIVAAQKSKLIDRLVVSTEDEEIAEVSRRYGVEIIPRPKEIAQDDSPIEDALRHAVTYLKEKEGYSTDLVVQMQANVPIREEGVIDAVIQKAIDTRADSVITIYAADQIPEAMKVLEGDRVFPRYELPQGYRRQDFPTLYLADGAVLATRTEVLFRTTGDRRGHAYLGSDIRGIIQDKIYATEIDSPDDIILAEAIMRMLNGGE